MQRNRDSRLDLAGGSWLVSRQNVAHVPNMPEAKESRQLLHYRIKVPNWPGRLLAAWTRNSTQSRGQVARTPCLGKTDFSHSLYPRFWEGFQREFWERNPREKQDWLIHNLHIETLQIPLLFLSIVKSLRGTLPKLYSLYPYLWEGCLVFWEAVKKGPISYW